MPKVRTITKAERTKWLDDYHAGMSMENLAKRDGRDSRTVKKWIEFTVDERDRERARTERYGDALRKHDESLLTSLRGLRAGLSVANHESITPSAHFPTSSRIDRNRITFEPDVSEFKPSPSNLDRDTRRMRQMLRQHLATEAKLWRDYDRWIERHDRFVWSCYVLGQTVGDQIKDRTGLDPHTGGSELNGFTEDFISWVCRLAIEAARDRTMASPESPTVTDGRQLVWSGAWLAASALSEELEAGKRAFMDLATELSTSEVVKSIAGELDALNATRESVEDPLADLLLLGVVGGRCDLCRRIGS